MVPTRQPAYPLTSGERSPVRMRQSCPVRPSSNFHPYSRSTVPPMTPMATVVAENSYMRSLPEIPWVVHFKPGYGAPRLVLFTNDPLPEKNVMKVGDLRSPAYTSVELMAFAAQAYKQTVRGQHGVGNEHAQLILDGPIQLLKQGRMLFCFSGHFFARYCHDTGLWILEGLSDGIREDKYFPVIHPRTDFITIQFTMKQRLEVKGIKLVTQQEVLTSRLTRLRREIKDIFPPRRIAGPASTVQRLYFVGLDYRLHAMTRERLFELSEQAGREGFYGTAMVDLERLAAPAITQKHVLTTDLRLQPK